MNLSWSQKSNGNKADCSRLSNKQIYYRGRKFINFVHCWGDGKQVEIGTFYDTKLEVKMMLAGADAGENFDRIVEGIIYQKIGLMKPYLSLFLLPKSMTPLHTSVRQQSLRYHVDLVHASSVVRQPIYIPFCLSKVKQRKQHPTAFSSTMNWLAVRTVAM